MEQGNRGTGEQGNGEQGNGGTGEQGNWETGKRGLEHLSGPRQTASDKTQQ